MTQRSESLPQLSDVRATWDAEAGKVRYSACFEGTDDWIEIPGEDFERLTRLFAQESIDFICDSIVTTLDRVKATLDDFGTFRDQMEKLAAMVNKGRTPSAPEGTGN